MLAEDLPDLLVQAVLFLELVGQEVGDLLEQAGPVLDDDLAFLGRLRRIGPKPGARFGSFVSLITPLTTLPRPKFKHCPTFFCRGRRFGRRRKQFMRMTRKGLSAAPSGDGRARARSCRRGPKTRKRFAAAPREGSRRGRTTGAPAGGRAIPGAAVGFRPRTTADGAEGSSRSRGMMSSRIPLLRPPLLDGCERYGHWARVIGAERRPCGERQMSAAAERLPEVVGQGPDVSPRGARRLETDERRR